MARHKNRALFFYQTVMKSEASARNSSISRCISRFVSLISSKIVSMLFSASLSANVRASSRREAKRPMRSSSVSDVGSIASVAVSHDEVASFLLRPQTF